MISQFNYSTQFLEALEQIPVKKTEVRITVLSFKSEKPICAIQGIATSGSISVNGSSAVRRTLSLGLIVDETMSDVTNIDNLISINKKINVEIGVKNILSSYQTLYGDTIWFPMGVYIISNAQITKNNRGISLSINGKDKMAQLDGTIGGTLPASITFHERQELTKDGEILVTIPTIVQIIQEAVVHFGQEDPAKVLINNVDVIAKILIKYAGTQTLWLSPDQSNFTIANVGPEGWDAYQQDEDVGYFMTSLTYPGELILSAGETVASLLDKIAKTLGNHEFFYDVYGRFIFQEKQNYYNKTYTPLFEIDGKTYVADFNKQMAAYSITDDKTTITYSNSPKIDNIKNDFIVWGSRTTAAGTTTAICYHLAIDEKPSPELTLQYMRQNLLTSQCEICSQAEYNQENENYKKIGPALKDGDWREELYRQALMAQNTGGKNSIYDDELISFWRTLYDPTNDSWKNIWNPAVKDDPGSLLYWLDFIDTTTSMGKYSVNQIGRRTKVVNNEKISKLYHNDIPDIVFLNQTDYLDKHLEDITGYDYKELQEHYDIIGQRYFQVQDNQVANFGMSASASSAYDLIRELLSQHLTYNTSVSITCLPKYYLEPNSIIFIYDKDSKIYGNYLVSQFTIPLTYNGTMNISATEILSRI